MVNSIECTYMPYFKETIISNQNPISNLISALKNGIPIDFNTWEEPFH